ncbi:Hypothetical protein POVR1_LOCUS287 [uncultured virus]|nr:Hypothetical protein POVR1_LOCUS287 [uncultured virus]
MDSNLLLDALIPNLSVNQLIDFYNTRRSWQQYLGDPSTLDTLTKQYKLNYVNSFSEFVTEYDKKTSFRFCYDRYGTLDHLKCLIPYIRDKNNYAFDVIVERSKNRIKQNNKGLLSEAVRTNNEHAVHKLTKLLASGETDKDDLAALPELLMRSLRYDNPAIAIDLVTYIKGCDRMKKFPNSRLKDIIGQDLSPVQIVLILRDKLLAEETYQMLLFDAMTV